MKAAYVPPGALRVVLSIAGSALVIAAVARPPLPDLARTIVVVVMAGVAAFSARSSLLLVAARKQRLVVDASARPHRLLFASAPAALLSMVLASPLILIDGRAGVFAAGLVGGLVGAALSLRDARPKGPRRTSVFAWLVVDTAIPAGVVSALVGVWFGFLRLHAFALVTPGELARHLAATTFLYALFVGLGGFLKAYGEQSAGLVVVDKVDREVPNPLVVGGIIALVLLFGVAKLAPPLALETALVVKALVGFIVGATVSLLGALQGARTASLGIKGP